MIIRSLGSMAAVELSNIRYVNEIKKQMNSFVEAMATAIDERTPYNGTHTRKVAKYSMLLIDKINEKYSLGETKEYFNEKRKESVRLASLLHDIGKLIVPRRVMNRATRMDYEMQTIDDRLVLLQAYYQIDVLKERITQEEYIDKLNELKSIKEFIHSIDSVGFLDDESYNRVQSIAKLYYKRDDGTKLYYITEYERKCLSIRKGTLNDEARTEMENHVVMTEKILSKVYFNKNYDGVSKWAATHHEFLDGSGYPKGLKAEELDIETRIITITDIYDALTSMDRPYKIPLSKEKAFKIL
jgi:HD-GYP domain-containing protein (c-di-GMP phosphodiesterase class II)